MLSVVMPVYNEVERVERAVESVLETHLAIPHELIVVDDGSTDGTRELLDAAEYPPEVRILKHDRNRGKGAAVRTGLEAAQGEFTAIFDADLEYDPRDFRILLEPLLAGQTNAVFGVRAFNGYSSHSYLFVLGNRFVTFLGNVLFNVYLGDLMTCHKVIRTDIFRSLDLQASGFAIEPEIAGRLLRKGERIYEVPVHYAARSSDEGKKLTTRDGLRVAAMLLRCRLA